METTVTEDNLEFLLQTMSKARTPKEFHQAVLEAMLQVSPYLPTKVSLGVWAKIRQQYRVYEEVDYRL